MGKGVLAGFAATLAVALLGSAIGQAQARIPQESGPQKSGLRIVSPAKHALVASRTVRLKVRGAGRGKVKVFNGTKRLKVRLSKPHHGVRTARLRRKRDLHRGTNVISVRTGGGFDQREFVLGRMRSGLLSLRRSPRRSHRGPVKVRARTSGAVDYLRARLNGHRVEGAFESKSPRIRKAALNASHGLRFGRNRLVVFAYRRDGRFDREVRRFKIDRSHPLAGAGRDRSTKAGRRLRLNGRASKRARRGDRLRYSWKVVAGPARKKARLKGAHTARPRLIAQRPGRYRLKLSVRETGRRNHGRHHHGQDHGHSASIATSSPGSGSVSASTSRVATDSTQVTVAPDVPPIGETITTMRQYLPLAIGGKAYPQPASQGPGPQLLVLDRKTLVEDSQAEQGYDFKSGGWSSLEKTVEKLKAEGDGYLVVLAGNRHQTDCDSTCMAAAKSVFTDLGGYTGNDALFQLNIKYGTWSLIGVPGSDSGSASQNLGMVLGAAADQVAGSMSGLLQVDNYSNFKFVWGAQLPIDTSLPKQPAGSNEIMVGNKTYRSDAGSYKPGMAGFQLLVLDQGTLYPYVNQTFWTNGQAALGDVVGINALAAALKEQIASANDLQLMIILQSIGTPTPENTTWPAWARLISPEISKLGGTSDVFAGMNHKGPGSGAHLGAQPGGYALVGGTGLPDHGTENAYWFTGQPARIKGMMTRNSRSQHVLGHSDEFGPSSGVSEDMGVVAYQPLTPWPVSSTKGERAANTYIAHQLGFGYDDVRTAYYEDDSVDWDSDAGRLKGMAYPGPSAGFSEQNFDAVQKQLINEFYMVAQVRALVTSYQQDLFGSVSENSDLVDLQQISHQIEVAVSANGNSNAKSGAEASEITGILLGVASAAGGIADPGIGVMISAASAAFQIAGSVSSDPQGNPLPGKVATKADQVGVELADRYGQIVDSLDHVGDLLVSDYGKLTVANQRAQNQWALSTADIDTTQQALRISSKRWVYGTLMPTAYVVYGLYGPWNSGTRITDPHFYRCYQKKWEGDPEFGSYHYSEHSRFEDQNWSTDYSGWDTLGTWRSKILSTKIEFFGDDHHYLDQHNENSTPPTGLTQPLFTSIEAGSGNLGMNQPTFFNQNEFGYYLAECQDKPN